MSGIFVDAIYKAQHIALVVTSYNSRLVKGSEKYAQKIYVKQFSRSMNRTQFIQLPNIRFVARLFFPRLLFIFVENVDNLNRIWRRTKKIYNEVYNVITHRTTFKSNKVTIKT